MSRRDKLHSVRISVDQPLDDVDLLQKDWHGVLELGRAADVGGPELKGSFGLFLPFSFFSSFQAQITIFTANECEKMSIQYMVPGFKLTTFGTGVSSHNH